VRACIGGYAGIAQVCIVAVSIRARCSTKYQNTAANPVSDKLILGVYLVYPGPDFETLTHDAGKEGYSNMTLELYDRIVKVF
jgi:hypothetical protein